MDGMFQARPAALLSDSQAMVREEVEMQQALLCWKLITLVSDAGPCSSVSWGLTDSVVPKKERTVFHSQFSTCPI